MLDACRPEFISSRYVFLELHVVSEQFMQVRVQFDRTFGLLPIFFAKAHKVLEDYFLLARDPTQDTLYLSASSFTIRFSSLGSLIRLAHSWSSL